MDSRCCEVHEQSHPRPAALPLDPSGKTVIIARAERQLDLFNGPAENEDTGHETVGGMFVERESFGVSTHELGLTGRLSQVVGKGPLLGNRNLRGKPQVNGMGIERTVLTDDRKPWLRLGRDDQTPLVERLMDSRFERIIRNQASCGLALARNWEARTVTNWPFSRG